MKKSSLVFLTSLIAAAVVADEAQVASEDAATEEAYASALLSSEAYVAPEGGDPLQEAAPEPGREEPIGLVQDPEEPDPHPVTFLTVSLATPIQIASEDAMVEGLRLNLLYGESFGVYGLDLGLVGFNRESAAGVSLYGAVNWTDYDDSGVKLSGLANVVCGNGEGLEISAIVNYNRGRYTGGQFALINHNGEFLGAQIGGFNYDKGVCYGLQLGVANAAVNEYHGWSLGLVNFADRLYGFQLGGVNIAAENGRGVQVGVFNCADNFIGMQIGLLNIIGNGDLPIMPILNARF